jgi:lysozyme family protein
MTRFDHCVAFVLDHENEYDSQGHVVTEFDPHDPGGATKYGIDQRSHPNVDIPKLTLEQAKKIYHEGEWRQCHCDQLPLGWDLALFDTAVNIGSERAIKLMQQVVGAKQDGIVGPLTLAAVKDAPLAPISALESFLQLREAYYRSLPSRLKNRYLDGWLNRVADVRRHTTYAA